MNLLLNRLNAIGCIILLCSCGATVKYEVNESNSNVIDVDLSCVVDSIRVSVLDEMRTEPKKKNKIIVEKFKDYPLHGSHVLLNRDSIFIDFNVHSGVIHRIFIEKDNSFDDWTMLDGYSAEMNDCSYPNY